MKDWKDKKELEAESLELEVVDFADLEQLEESIAPIFMLAAAAGGTCSGGSGSGCICKVAV